VALGAPVPAITPNGGGQTIPTRILGGGGRYLLTWGVQQPDLGWHTFVASLNEDGTILGGPTLLYAEIWQAYPGACLAQGGGRAFAVWQQQPTTDPAHGTTWFASIDPTSGAVLAAETVEQGVTHFASSVALDAQGDDVAVHHWNDLRTVIFSRPQAGGAFSERASLPATSPAALAVTPCGRLVALVPTGPQIPDDPLVDKGLLVQPIGAQGVEGAPLSLPVGGDHVESMDIAAVDGGLVVAWVEASSAQSPERTRHMAYVQMP
jgi:hypothetical protein